MKVSDYIVSYLEKCCDSVFLLSGGAVMHVVDSIGRSSLNAYCVHHEQAAAIAAEGYARIKNDVGVVCVTSGPGATNAITGVAGAWLDSIPMLVISGQVKTPDLMPRLPGRLPAIRQLGFQELNIIDMVQPITKYAFTVRDKRRIRYHLEKALHLARTGRPGPVWLDLPLDVTADNIDVTNLDGFEPDRPEYVFPPKIPMGLIVDALQRAERPLLMIGNGVRLADGVETLWKLLDKLSINVVSTIFTSDDIVTSEYPYYLGRQGMPGNYAANWAIDNCDVLLVVGERLQITNTSYNAAEFAKQALTIMVDIDPAEFFKPTIAVDIPVHCDAKVFLEALRNEDLHLHRWDVEIAPVDPSNQQGLSEFVNPYRFIETLNGLAVAGDFSTADGMASLIPHQVLRLRRGQRFLTNAGLGHMGSGLPLAIGASVASGKGPVVCFEGDGSLMLNIQELETVVYHRLPIKVMLFNNGGYFSIRNTHTNYFNRPFASDPSCGVGFPDFGPLITGWGLPHTRINRDAELGRLAEVLQISGPAVCEVMIDPRQPMLPRWSAGDLRETFS